jgi:hypothetical protein
MGGALARLAFVVIIEIIPAVFVFVVIGHRYNSSGV